MASASTGAHTASGSAQSTHGNGSAPLSHHFHSYAQQSQSVSLGIWLFLVTEVMFFGGLFMTYILYRSTYPHDFAAGSHILDVRLGTTNTGVLITSSLTMAMAVWSAQTGRRKVQVLFLILTMLLGLAFLGIKSIEYAAKWREHLIPGPDFTWEGPPAPHVRMFFSLYFAMTGLHALHMIIGIGCVGGLLGKAWRGVFGPLYNHPVEATGLYWHFVDIVWIFLFPLLYLIGRH